MSHVLFSVRRVVLLVAALAVLSTAVLMVPVLPAGAAGTQVTVFDHTGSQTASQYFSPTLNQPGDYTAPVDYSQGRVFVRLEVFDKISDAAMIPQLCFWRHTETVKFKYETCAITKKYAFTGEGTYWIDAGTPAKWYKKNGTWDWSVPASLGRIMMKDPVSGKLWLTSRCGKACYPGDDIDEHMPIKFDAEVIFVAAGATLNPPAGWQANCPTTWSNQCGTDGDNPPPPEPTPPPTPEPTPAPEPTPVPAPDEPAIDGPEYVTVGVSARTPTVTAVRGSDAIATTWTSVAGASEYQFRWDTEGGARKWDKATTKLSRVLDGADPTKTHVVAVRAKLKGTWRPWTSVTVPPVGHTAPADDPAPDPEPEPDPSGDNEAPATAVTKWGNGSTTPTVIVTPLDGGLAVEWKPLPKAHSYQFRYRRIDGKSQWDAPTSDLSRTVTGLTNGVKHLVFVRAYVNKAWQGWTKVAVTPVASGNQSSEGEDPVADIGHEHPPAEEPAPEPGDGEPPVDGDDGGHGVHLGSGGEWVRVADESVAFPEGRTSTRYAFLDPDDNPDPNWTKTRIGFMVECGHIGYEQIDPIVNPGAPQSAHVHEFFGNPVVDPDSTTQSLVDVPRSQIDCTDKNDKSAYWAPAVYQDGERVEAELFKAYYKSTTPDVVPMPLGLRMIAGDATATKNQSQLVGGWVGEGNKHNHINTFGKNKMIEILDPDINVTLRINFPNCWDGKHLDSPDHASHMAYFDEATKSCPASHPVKVPQLTTFTQYPITGGDGMSLASGEWYTFHQDFWNAWSPAQMADLTDECIVAGMNCRLKTTPKLQKLGQYYDYVPG